MKSMNKTIGTMALVLAFVMTSALSMADEKKVFTTPDDIRAEITEAMEAVSDYSVQERKSAVAKTREALNQLDAEIDRREDAVRENWSEMSDATRQEMREQLQELRQMRNRVGERFGALESGTEGAWTELKDGFASAWDAFAKAWSKADASSN